MVAETEFYDRLGGELALAFGSVKAGERTS